MMQVTQPILDDKIKIENENDNFSTPLSMLSSDLYAAFERGEEAFQFIFMVEDGLGPLFNNESCVGCHPGNGRGSPDNTLIRFSQGHNLLIDMGGPQLDMGEELADNRPDGSATGREWKTAPLWGTRLVSEFLGGTPFFLHDGRATTLQGAIRTHGGEAQKAKQAFFELSENQQKAVIAFIESL